MAFGIGKGKDASKEPKKGPKPSKKTKEQEAPAAAAPQAAPGAPLLPGEQRSAVVRGGKKSRRKGSSLTRGSRGGVARPTAPGKKAKAPAASVQDIILRAFPTLAKALGKDVGNVGKAQKRKKKPDKPTLPIVNLLPPRFTVIRERNSAIRGFVISGLGILFAAGTMYVIQGTALNAAQSTLTSSQAQIAEATARLSQYGDVGSFFDQVQQRLNLEKSLKANELDFVALNNEIQGFLPAGTSIDEITITPPPKPAEGSPVDGTICGPKADPFSQDKRVPVACITVKGTLPSIGALTQLNNAFAESKYMFNVLFVQAQGQLGALGPSQIFFTGTIAVADSAKLINTNLAGESEALPSVEIDPGAPVVPAPTNPTAAPTPAPGGNN